MSPLSILNIQDGVQDGCREGNSYYFDVFLPQISHVLANMHVLANVHVLGSMDGIERVREEL